MPQERREAEDLLSESLRPSELELKDQKIRDLQRQVRSARKEAAQYRQLLDAIAKLGRPVVTKIDPRESAKGTEGVAVLTASDWHVEEIVDPNTVNGLNRYNPKISKKRGEEFFRIGLKLTDIIARDIPIHSMVCGLLGDFITNDIHEDSAENCAMRPIEAAQYAQDLIASGINFWLNHSKRRLHFICHSGNHGRTTKRIHHANEKGHSLEYFMYSNLAKLFDGEDRVSFDVAKGYHTYCNILSVRTRWHHGHNISYAGGVGGITIPVNKAIAQWDKARQADVDFFGHFHQHLDHGKWYANGSLIGYNAYAVSIKAEPEPPMQSFAVIDNVRGRTWSNPIYVER